MSAIRIIETKVPLSPGQAWEAVLSPRLLERTSRPVLRIDPAALPAHWEVGTDYEIQILRLFRKPLTHRIRFLRIDRENREYETTESNALVRHWSHRLSVEAASDGGALIRDVLEIGSKGGGSWFYASFAYLLYRWRRKRLGSAATAALP